MVNDEANGSLMIKNSLRVDQVEAYYEDAQVWIVAGDCNGTCI